MRDKANWCFRWFDRATHPFAVRLVGFANVEGIFLCSSFSAIYWFRSRGLLPVLCFSNELVARYETMQMRFVCMLYSELLKLMSRAAIVDLVEEAVVMDKAFVAGWYR